MEGKQIKFGIEISPELHRKLKVAVAERGTSMKQATAEALAAWLAAAEAEKKGEKSVLTPLREGAIIFPEASEILDIMARISDDERSDLIEYIRAHNQLGSADVQSGNRARGQQRGRRAPKQVTDPRSNIAKAGR